ncbi:hypothetical protein V4Y04_32390 [Streptomyces sp. P9-A2]
MPALVNRLRPEEFVVCDRDEHGASIIPALTVDKVKEIVEESGGATAPRSPARRCDTG